MQLPLTHELLLLNKDWERNETVLSYAFNILFQGSEVVTFPCIVFRNEKVEVLQMYMLEQNGAQENYRLFTDFSSSAYLVLLVQEFLITR